MIIWNYKEGDWVSVGIGSMLYATFVFCFFALFVFSLFSFIRSILRNNNQKASSLHEMERLQKEQNELLKELIHSIKEKISNFIVNFVCFWIVPQGECVYNIKGEQTIGFIRKILKCI